MRYSIHEVSHQDETIVCVLYQSLRIEHNYTLFYSFSLLDQPNKRLEVIIPLDYFKHLSKKQMMFVKEAIAVLADCFKYSKISFKVVECLDEYLKAISIYTICTDLPYIQLHQAYTTTLPINITCFIDGNVMVPTRELYPKEAYNAHVLRLQLNRQIEDYLSDFNDIEYQSLLKNHQITHDMSQQFNLNVLEGGYIQAHHRFSHFIQYKLQDYATNKNNPTLEATSCMSPYLNYGMISIHTMVKQLKNLKIDQPSVTVFLEELITRRSLAYNFCFYNAGHDVFETLNLGQWVKDTMQQHLTDTRPYLYTYEMLYHAKTHDDAFNSAMRQLHQTGMMHGYMRMYWGKKIIEWSVDYKTAFNYMLQLNNELSLDGYHPNSYAGVAWCFGKHDRPFFSNTIFGTIRYMNASGLNRKFKINAYIERYRKY